MTLLETPAEARHHQPPADLYARRPLVVLGVLGAFAFAIVLRFWTRSDLWLDEALTVNIARRPVGEIFDLLRHDGAPPLYYVLLHWWIEIFGEGPVAVRSLSGVISVATLPMMWRAGLITAGRRAAWVATLLLASSPFVVRFATEARMYSLVVFLVVGGYLALRWLHARPSPVGFLALAVCSGLLALTHYWAFFLLLTVVAGLALDARRGDRRAVLAIGAIASGGVLFLPWLPTFLFQLQHTGTPWATPANFATIVNAIGQWSGGPSQAGRALLILLFAGALIGLFGRGVDHHRIELDLRGRAPGNRIAFVTFGTMALAIVAGYALRSGFAGRYSAVAIAPFFLLVANGATTIVNRRVFTALVAVAVTFGLVAAVPNITRNRTQAGAVAASLQRHAKPGDVVGYCPDQLGPAVTRLAPPGLRHATFPAMGSPEIVDWVDYADRVRAGDPDAFARDLHSLAGAGQSVWLVWMGGYRTLGRQCQLVVRALTTLRGEPHGAVVANARFFERSSLLWFPAG